MKQQRDLVGKRFGKLTVESIDSTFYTDKGIKRRWNCRCDCGRKIITREDYLTRGQRTYCGDCMPPAWISVQNRLCRRCEWSSWDKDGERWECSHGCDTSLAQKKCGGFWCSAEDKINGLKNRESKCIVCGKPIYSFKTETPIYCYEHRKEAEQDMKIIDEAPKELLFCLIQGIFERAREDYLSDIDGQRGDAEVFLRSPWAQTLSLSSFDAEDLIDSLNEELEYGH